MSRFNDFRGKRIALKLRECVKLVRSKNAGPFELTIDVMFSNPTLFRSCVKTGVLGPQNIANIYNIPDELIKVFEIEIISTIKISFPRPISQGDLGDADNHGGQQYSPLLDLEINNDG